METIPAKTILYRTKDSSWFGQDFNMNLYKGCNHGCIYCDSRSTCYHNEDFSRVKIKENSLDILRSQLSRAVKRGVVGTGAMNDPYNSFEKEGLFTRKSLELLDTYEFGVSIATKGDLIRRDMDILQNIRRHSPVICKLTITTLDDSLAKKLEPGAPPPSQRLAALKDLARENIYCGVLLMPVMPDITDNEKNILEIVEKSAEIGVKFIFADFGLTMREGQREYLYEGFRRKFPRENYTTIYRQRYGLQYYCPCPHAERLYTAFSAACSRHGLLTKMQDITAGYKQGYGPGQLSLFD